MSGVPAPAPFAPDYYDNKSTHHVIMLDTVRRQSVIFRKLGEKAVALWRKHRLNIGHITSAALDTHEWFGFNQTDSDAGLRQMDSFLSQLLDEINYAELIDLASEMVPEKGRATYLGARLSKTPSKTVSYYLAEAVGGPVALPTVNGLKRLSTHLKTKDEWNGYKNTLNAHGIRIDPMTNSQAHRLIEDGVGVQIGFLPGLCWNDLTIPHSAGSPRFDIDQLRVLYPCLQTNGKLAPGGHKLLLDTAKHRSEHNPIIYLGCEDYTNHPPGYITTGEKESDSDHIEGPLRWCFFYQQSSGVFAALMPEPEDGEDEAANRNAETVLRAGYGGWSTALQLEAPKHGHNIVAQTSISKSLTEAGWNNLLSETVKLKLKVVGHKDTAAGKMSDVNLDAHYDALVKALGAQVFLRVCTELPIESPPLHIKYDERDRTRHEYIHPVLSHAVSEIETEKSTDEVRADGAWVESWKDKRGILHYNQGDGRYYHNLVRCSLCNGRVIVTLPKLPVPAPPFPCPHCKEKGLEIETGLWSELA